MHYNTSISVHGKGMLWGFPFKVVSLRKRAMERVHVNLPALRWPRGGGLEPLVQATQAHTHICEDSPMSFLLIIG